MTEVAVLLGAVVEAAVLPVVEAAVAEAGVEEGRFEFGVVAERVGPVVLTRERGDAVAFAAGRPAPALLRGGVFPLEAART